MTLAQLAYRESLREYRGVPTGPWRATLPHGIAREGLAHDVARRERVPRLADLWDFAQVLIAIARPLYAGDRRRLA